MILYDNATLNYTPESLYKVKFHRSPILWYAKIRAGGQIRQGHKVILYFLGGIEIDTQIADHSQ